MAKRITKLTAEQEAALPAFREHWRQIGLSTDAIDPEAAREAVRELYRAGNAEPPHAVIVLASPMACLLARAICEKLLRQDLTDNQRAVLERKLRDQLGGQLRAQLGGQLGGQLRAQLGGQLRAQLRAQLRGQLGDQLGGQLRDQLWGQLRAQLRAQLWDQLWGQLGAQLWDQLGGQLWAQLGGQLRAQLGGQLFQSSYFIGNHDAYWLAFYDYGEQIGARYGDSTRRHFDAYKAYALRCGWLYPYKSIAFVSDRPELICFDDARRLHGETGPAVRFRDGWSLYAWHGTRVPAAWIDDKASLTPQVALKQPNLELRRAACEIIGWARILSELQAKTIDSDADPQIGDLVSVRLPDLPEPAKFLKVRCGTGRDFAIGIPPHINKALDAQAWIIGLEPEDFVRPEVRA